MSAGKLTPYEAANKATREYWRHKLDSVEDGCLRAIELYETSRKRVQLTPEQEKAFEERVEVLSVVSPIRCGRLTTFLDTGRHTPESLRNLAACAEALADNLERFPL